MHEIQGREGTESSDLIAIDNLENNGEFCNKKESASMKKVATRSSSENYDDRFRGYIVMDKDLLYTFLMENLTCKSCLGPIQISEKRKR